MKEAYDILLIGAGQIGSRHLQGLKKCSYPLRIYVVDTTLSAGELCKKRWDEASQDIESKSIFSFHTNLDECPRRLDVVIISTGASERFDVVSSLMDHAHVQYWILEKVLVRSSSKLDGLLALIKNQHSAWVNLPRRTLSWHKRIRDTLTQGSRLKLEVLGNNWGLACNSLHFLDMLAWFSGESLVHISTQRLDGTWFPAKRQGNWEVFGMLAATFSGGSTATLFCDGSSADQPAYEFKLKGEKFEWCIVEERGVAIRSDGLSIPGRLPFQSEATGLLVDELLSTGQCELPTLVETAQIHRVFLDSLLSHWCRTVDSLASEVPIT